MKNQFISSELQLGRPSAKPGGFLQGKGKGFIKATAQRLGKRLQGRRKAGMFQDKEQLILSILDNLPASIHIQAPDYSILFANRYFSEHFGPPEGKKCYEVLAGLQEPCEVCQAFRTFDTKSPQKWSIKALDGRVYEIPDHECRPGYAQW